MQTTQLLANTYNALVLLMVRGIWLAVLCSLRVDSNLSLTHVEMKIFVAKGAEATLCCTRLSSYLMDRMSQYNSNRPQGKNPIPFGSKIWVGSSLGLYFTIGHQDLESFFEEGRKLAQARFEQAMDADEHRYGEP